MKRDKYMGMDVHQATTVVAVIDAEGKIVLGNDRTYCGSGDSSIDRGYKRAPACDA